MANQSTAARRVDPLITTFIAAAHGGDKNLKARELFKAVPVSSKAFQGVIFSDDPRQYTGDSQLITGTGLDVEARAPSPEARSYDPLQGSYECRNKRHKGFVTKEEEDRSLFPMKEQERMTGSIVSTMDLRLEYLTFVDFVFNDGLWPTSTVALLPGGVGLSWRTAGSSPARDGIAMCLEIRRQRGVKPSIGAITKDVLEVLRFHPESLDIYGAVAQGLVRAPTHIDDDDVLIEIWRKKWKLRKLVVVDQQYNAGRPGAALSLTDIGSGFVWFGCDQGLKGAVEVKGGASVRGGPVSLVRIEEKMPRGYQWRTDDPIGTYVKYEHSYTYFIPADMDATAFLLTGVV